MTDEERNWTNMVNTCKSFQGICISNIRGPKEDAVLWADAEVKRLREAIEWAASEVEMFNRSVAIRIRAALDAAKEGK